MAGTISKKNILRPRRLLDFVLVRRSDQSNSPWQVALSATKELSGGIFWMIGTKVMPGRRFNLFTLFNELQSRSELRKIPATVWRGLPNWICYSPNLQAYHDRIVASPLLRWRTLRRVSYLYFDRILLPPSSLSAHSEHFGEQSPTREDNILPSYQGYLNI